MKQIGISILIGVTTISTSALAQNTMYLAGYGGSFQRIMEEDVIPPFEAEHDVKITYVAGRSSQTVAKLQAQKGNQEINVAIVDDGPMFQAIQFGFCGEIVDAPVYKDVYDVVAPAAYGGHAVGAGLIATGIAYNTETFKEKGWDAPRSWKDLTDPKFEQRVASSPIGGTYGLHALVMFARMNGGDENNVEPGFTAVRDNLVPNVLTWSSNNDQLAQLFQSGDIDIAVWGSSRAKALKDTGVPIGFVYPEEGSPIIAASVCPVVDNDLPEVSQAFVQYMVSPQVQKKLTKAGFGPTNKKTELDADVAADLPYGEDRISNLINVDWDVINRHRDEWTKEWNRTVER